ncbi:hypothetical protein BKP37_10650 [Anaerobacillus alkalilacustris]|uniref:Semialdehyde dehydrogenase NAD-binding domain-containing protein n=1 Tax=Anaerobacillus alkalilacustris TaxID=393763 RepID=A0A1S2LM57_9BACI|nr:NAD-dependent epimerase/dehydratase family protein [Anaerobacillus alkalilacustris]OIJ13424.1 hypothetical protein BKP37_10650 [Anaerobacillus alkalilacustris]
MNKKTALIFGATGLVGNELIKLLLQREEYYKIVSVSRRSVGLTHEKLKEYIVDFNKLEQYEKLFKVDTVFCALGTTMKQAKTKEQFIKVDFDFPLKIAELAKENGVRQFFIITAMGANPKSKFFYNRVKGDVEGAIKELQLPSLYIVRPSLLLGNRKDNRLGEEIGQMIAVKLPFLFGGPFQKYKPNRSEDVARAMYNLSLNEQRGVYVIETSSLEDYNKK